jgi:lipopolysaccharide biosynthesis glycosyltransferase
MSDSDRVAVFFCIAGNYWPHGAVAVSSIARCASCLNVWIFYEKPNQRWQSKIRHLRFIRINRHICSNRLGLAPRDQGVWSLGLFVFYRLFVPELLPKSFRRIVYLDADFIIRRSIRELFVRPLGDCVIAAVYGQASRYC